MQETSDQAPAGNGVRFGPFELLVETGELRENGVRLKLSGQPIQVLARLVATPGQLVTREQLQDRLWPGSSYGDFEKGLNAAVNRLRENLGDSATEPKYIETIPGRGYRFIADTDTGSSNVPPAEFQRAKPRWKHRILFVGVALLSALGSGALAYWGMRSPAAPRVSNYVQLTHDGLPKVLIGTDSSRLYLRLESAVSVGIGAIALTGGEPTRIPSPFAGTYPLNLSPDGSQLLVLKSKIGPGNRSLYSLALLGGATRRLGDALGWDGAWSSDGKLLAYTNDNNLFIARADGTESRKLVTMKGYSQIDGPVWSPDGSHLRFNVWENWDSSLWEVAEDGSELHRLLLPGGSNPSDECCGRWTADGKYFIFQSNGQIWTLPQNRHFLQRNPSPIQLTWSPLALSSPLPSRDGKKLFVVGEADRGELVRYDSNSGQFVPFLGGISADFLTFSKDGQWVAYVSYPEGTLWRSKADGSEPLQLTFVHGSAIMPRWSPDGKTIIFCDQPNAGKPYRIYEVSPEGGTPRELLPADQGFQLSPDWSPDEKKIVFGGRYDDPQSVIRIVDLANGQVSTVAGSQGFYDPRWSPNGRYIVACAFGPHRLVLFDFETQKWTDLLQGSGYSLPSWSKDGVYVYDVLGFPMSAVVRIRISDNKSEQVVDLRNFTIAGVVWLALALDDSPVLLRDTGIQDVYALDWEAP
jgi:Tol biopolymer transport system component/DNA-binding winged helix-turn-helix (wHTH) protein